MDSKKLRVHGNPEVLKSDSIWFAGTRWLGLNNLIISTIALATIIALGLPIMPWQTRWVYILGLGTFLSALIFLGNHLFYKGSALESLDAYGSRIKFNRIREYKRRLAVNVPDKSLPDASSLLAALVPLLPTCRVSAFRDCVILIGNSYSSMENPNTDRVYLFIVPTETGVRIVIRMYPLLIMNSTWNILHKSILAKTELDDLKNVARYALTALPDAPAINH